MRKILLVVLLIPLFVFADRVTKKTQTEFTFETSGAATSALAKNKNRKGLIISNNGADAIYVQFGTSSAIATLDGMKLAANTAYEFTNVPMDIVYIKGGASTGTRKVGIIEFE